MKPNSIYLINGIIAMSSAVRSYFLISFQEIMRMPEQYLYVFIGVSIVLTIYSISCYCFSPLHSKKYLRILCIANLLYSVLTAFAVYENYSSLLLLGKAYFMLEIAIILVLCSYEYYLLTKK